MSLQPCMEDEMPLGEDEYETRLRYITLIFILYAYFWKFTLVYVLRPQENNVVKNIHQSIWEEVGCQKQARLFIIRLFSSLGAKFRYVGHNVTN